MAGHIGRSLAAARPAGTMSSPAEAASVIISSARRPKASATSSRAGAIATIWPRRPRRRRRATGAASPPPRSTMSARSSAKRKSPATRRVPLASPCSAASADTRSSTLDRPPSPLNNSTARASIASRRALASVSAAHASCVSASTRQTCGWPPRPNASASSASEAKASTPDSVPLARPSTVLTHCRRAAERATRTKRSAVAAGSATSRRTYRPQVRSRRANRSVRSL